MTDQTNDQSEVRSDVSLTEYRMAAFRKLIKEIYPLDAALGTDLGTILLATLYEPLDAFVCISAHGSDTKDLSMFPAQTRASGEAALAILARSLFDMTLPLVIIDLDHAEWWMYDLELKVRLHGVLGKGVLHAETESLG